MIGQVKIFPRFGLLQGLSFQLFIQLEHPLNIDVVSKPIVSSQEFAA